MKLRISFPEFVLGLFATIAVPVLLWFFFVRQTPEDKRSVCLEHVWQIMLAVHLYSQDADDKLPMTRPNATKGWGDTIAPYLKSEGVFQCPSTLGSKEGTSDYFFNRRVSGLSLTKISEPLSVVLRGDGEDDAPKWNSWSQLPPDATTNKYSPTQRHIGNGIYVCIGGNLILTKPQSISSQPMNANTRPTFDWR